MTLYCPITGLNVFSEAEWRNQNVSNTFRSNFWIINGLIIYSRPEGYADLKGVIKSLALNDNVAQFISEDSPFVQIEDYAALSGASPEARKYFTNWMKDNKRTNTLIFCNLSLPMAVAIRMGRRLTSSNKEIHIAGNYSDALNQALAFIPPENFKHNKAPIDISKCYNNKIDSMSPIDIQSDAAWNIQTPEYSNQAVVVDHHILHSTSEGYLKSGHIPLIEDIRDLCQSALTENYRIEYIVVDCNRQIGGSRAARTKYMQSLKNWHQRYPLRMYIVYGANTFMKTALHLAKPLMPFKVRIAKDIGHAFQMIHSDRSEKVQTTHAEQKKKMIRQVTHEDIEKFMALIGSLDWEQEGIDYSFNVDKDHPFYFLYQSIALIKEELDDLLKQRNRLEEQLYQSRKMESIGTLAGGIAHDFNNLLMGIQGRASLIAMEAASSHPLTEHTNAIEKYINSAANLTKQLLGFARGGKYEVSLFDLNDLVLDSLDMFARTRKDICIHTGITQKPLIIEADEQQIEQVLLNIYINSGQAMPNGGKIRLETSNILLDNAQCKPYKAKPGTYAKILIADTGTGIDQATCKRIFEPFFTTKEKGRGTGLGLASAYGIIQNHGGWINVESEVGHGTIFKIYLPASEKEIPQEVTFENKVVQGSETILLVDDEEPIINVGTAILKKLGYEVVAAQGGRPAIETLQRSGEEIDLVILDMIMPGMDGGKVFDRIREIKPDMPVILSSGYSLNGQANEIMQRGCNGFMQKPFTVSEISQKVRKVINKTQEPAKKEIEIC